MIAASFDESTECLSRPSNMADDRCDPLAIARADMDGIPVVVSCWKLTQEELKEFQRTGRIWLIVAGNTIPPVILTAIKPFK